MSKTETEIEKWHRVFDERFSESLNTDPTVGQSSLQMSLKDYIKEIVDYYEEKLYYND